MVDLIGPSDADGVAFKPVASFDVVLRDLSRAVSVAAMSFNSYPIIDNFGDDLTWNLTDFSGLT
ncbi:hypothetical protein [Roseobacter sp. MH60115]|uniref:hypothetical protein n=1 Tax=Roseobacter sp. MH60115 TaxID=2785324 RepID=UPI0018A2A494|nr:hypothetical protein [Roseobacter sp. MH60115]